MHLSKSVIQYRCKNFLKRNGGDVVSFLYDELTREECIAIRENDAYLFGLEDGEAHGFTKGFADGKRATALNMLQEKLPHDLILRTTGISPEELQRLIAQASI